MKLTTQNPDKSKKFVDDLNWINNTLHDFAIRTAFVEITETCCAKNPKLKDVPFIMNIYNAMANDAVVKMSNIYDTHRDTLSIYYILNWIRGNVSLLENHIDELVIKEDEIVYIENKIKTHSELIEKFRRMRKKLLAHNDKKIVQTTDIRRRLLNNKKIKTENDFIQESQKYMEELKGFLLDKQDFVGIQNFTFEVLTDIQQLLKMPDRIFGKSGNRQEWEDFYNLMKKDALQFFNRF